MYREPRSSGAPGAAMSVTTGGYSGSRDVASEAGPTEDSQVVAPSPPGQAISGRGDGSTQVHSSCHSSETTAPPGNRRIVPGTSGSVPMGVSTVSSLQTLRGPVGDDGAPPVLGSSSEGAADPSTPCFGEGCPWCDTATLASTPGDEHCQPTCSGRAILSP